MRDKAWVEDRRWLLSMYRRDGRFARKLNRDAREISMVLRARDVSRARM